MRQQVEIILAVSALTKILTLGESDKATGTDGHWNYEIKRQGKDVVIKAEREIT